MELAKLILVVGDWVGKNNFTNYRMSRTQKTFTLTLKYTQVFRVVEIKFSSKNGATATFCTKRMVGLVGDTYTFNKITKSIRTIPFDYINMTSEQIFSKLNTEFNNYMVDFYRHYISD